MTIQNTTIQDSDKEGFAYLNAIALGEIPPPKFTSDITFWSHERNNPLIGKVVDFSEFEHESYGPQKTVIVERENREMVSAILTPYLQNGVVLQNCEVGDLVLIEKKNKERSKYGKVFNRFEFVVKKQA